MQKCMYPISKEEYEKALHEGADSIIGDAIHMGYGVYGAKVFEQGGVYYLAYERGDSCD